MWCTACTDIYARNIHNTDLSFNFNLTSVSQIFQLFLCRVKNLYIQILVNDAIRLFFDFFQLLLCNRSVKIHRTVISSKMESYIVVSESSMYNSWNDMLAAMLLHTFESLFPVNFAFRDLARCQCAICIMIDNSILLLRVQHMNPSKNSCICILSAAFREKYCLIQNYFVSFSFRFTWNYLCLKIFSMTTFVVQLVCHVTYKSFL